MKKKKKGFGPILILGGVVAGVIAFAGLGKKPPPPVTEAQLYILTDDGGDPPKPYPIIT